LDYPSKEASTSKEKEKAAWLEMLAPQSDALGTVPELPWTKLMSKYQTIVTMSPNSARVKKTLRNIDCMIRTMQNSQ
jgi:hypothetical protein